MPIMTGMEVINLIILTLAVGYIFSGFIKDPSHRPTLKQKFNLQDFKFALLVSAPGVVLHELAHKFASLAFGLTANFFVFWWGLGIGVFLKLISSPFILLAPGYVGIGGNPTELQMVITAFAGPAVNLILFLVASYILSHAKQLTRKKAIALYLTKKINLLLFIFNMLPIPPLDGSKVIFGLFRILTSSF